MPARAQSVISRLLDRLVLLESSSPAWHGLIVERLLCHHCSCSLHLMASQAQLSDWVTEQVNIAKEHVWSEEQPTSTPESAIDNRAAKPSVRCQSSSVKGTTLGKGGPFPRSLPTDHVPFGLMQYLEGASVRQGPAHEIQSCQIAFQVLLICAVNLFTWTTCYGRPHTGGEGACRSLSNTALPWGRCC